MKLKFNLFLIFLGFGLEVSAQKDTAFTEAVFLSRVVAYHPIAVQANLIGEQGDAFLLTGRGGFDPKLYFDYLTKDFTQKDYFDLLNVGLKVPTWYGLEVKAGWEYAYGSFVNPQNFTPVEGLGYAGVSFSPNGLFMDKRKSTLLKAKEYQSMSWNERDNLVNDLLRDAITQYWKWASSYQKFKVLEQTLTNSENRFQNIREYFYQGELSVLDTLEAYTQIQAVRTEMIEQQAAFEQQTFNLDAFLWDEGLVPLVLVDAVPEPMENKIFSMAFNQNFEEINSLVASHPLIQAYNDKLEALRIDQKYRTNQVMPKIELQYNVLTTGVPSQADQNTRPSSNNYKWGVTFGLPILLRKERGELEMAKIKVKSQELKIKGKEQQLVAKANGYKAKTEGLRSQLQTYSDAVDGYETLLEQETLKLREGESSLFKLTNREIKMFKAKLKLVELQLKLIEAKTFYVHSTGELYLMSPRPTK